MGSKGKGIKMTFREQLVKLEACPAFLELVGDKTIEEAWKTCNNSGLLLLILSKTDFDLTDPICDIAERVLHLIPENIRLMCIKNINAARSRANEDELKAAIYATNAAYNGISASTSAATDDAVDAACYAAWYSIDHSAASATNVASFASDASAGAFNPDTYNTSYIQGQKNQCDIFRKYFTIDQVKEAFNKLVA
jgi:hypothetical protein